MKSITQEFHIKAPVDEVWGALIDSRIIDAWGGGPSKMSAEVGFEFSLWDGEIFGKNIEVVENKKLVQEWIEGKWDKASSVTFVLTKEDDGTRIDLIHADYPEREHDDLEHGWKDFYLEPLKEYLEK
jgi:activator of HSP90 ATPase